MASKNKAVFGMYPEKASVEEAVEAFLRAGFRSADVSFLQPENMGTKDFAHEKHTKAPEGAALGLIPGGILGAGLGWLAAFGLLMVPGVEPLIAAGPILAALAGLGVGAVLGAAVGASIGAVIPEYEARRYEGRVRNRGVLFSVHCDNSVWVKRARKLLEETGSTHVAIRSEGKADFATSDTPRPRRVPVRI